MRKYFFVDTETTGLSDTCEAWQIGILVTDENGNWLTSFESTCKPQAEFEAKAFEMSGLTQEQLDSFQTPAELLTKVLNFIKENAGDDRWDNTIVCHNVAYDIPILTRMFKQYLGSDEFRKYIQHGDICTMQALRMLKVAGRWPYKNCRLDTVHQILGTEAEAHTALADAKATSWLFFEIQRNLRKNRLQKFIDRLKRLFK